MINKEKNRTENKLPTIYFVWNYLQWGGVQIYFLGLMRSVAHKYRVKAILPEHSDEKLLNYLKDNNVEYEFYVGKMDTAKPGTLFWSFSRRWKDFLNNVLLAKHLSGCNLKNSIIQIDVAPWVGLTVLLYLVLKTDVFVTFHTALPEISFVKKVLWKIKFAVLTRFHRFHIAASNLDVKESLKLYVSETRYHQIEIIYSSINRVEIDGALKHLKPREEIALRYNFPADKKWVCSVAQFIERKGCWIFLEAAAELREKRADLFFLWLGTAPLSDETKAAIEKYDLQDSFRFLSAKEIGNNRNDLLTLLAAADLFVLPSFQEGLPVALIEAMALGKTCLASRVNAIPEAVKHLETGILVDAGDSKKLAEAIDQIINNPDLSAKIGAKAREHVLENFEEQVTGAKMLRLYDNIQNDSIRVEN